MKKTVLLAQLFAVTILFTSCQEDMNIEANWTLIAIEDANTNLSFNDGTLTTTVTMYVDMQDEAIYKIAGFSGVNNFNGTVTRDKNSITVSPLAVTMMMGIEAAQKAEDMFLKTLQEGGKLSTKETDNGTVLQIENSKNETTLQFIQTVLENTVWNLSMYNVGNAVTNVPASVSGVNIGFSTDGKVYGSTGVNQMMATYEYTEDGAITISAVGITRMAAPNQEVRDFEMKLLELLEQVAIFEMSGDRLTFRNANEETMLVYSR